MKGENAPLRTILLRHGNGICFRKPAPISQFKTPFMVVSSNEFRKSKGFTYSDMHGVVIQVTFFRLTQAASDQVTGFKCLSWKFLSMNESE